MKKIRMIELTHAKSSKFYIKINNQPQFSGLAASLLVDICLYFLLSAFIQIYPRKSNYIRDDYIYAYLNIFSNISTTKNFTFTGSSSSAVYTGASFSFLTSFFTSFFFSLADSVCSTSSTSTTSSAASSSA
jgi:hypothetical protein